MNVDLKKHVIHISNALRFSLVGLYTCFKDEAAFRQECFIAIPHFLAVAFLPLPAVLRIFLSLLWVLLVTVELLNTAIEAVVNLVTLERHPLAKKAKDCASAAVFCVVMLLVMTWGFVIVFLLHRSL